MYNLTHLHSLSLLNHSSVNTYVSGCTNNQMKLDNIGSVTDGPPTPTQEIDIVEHRKCIVNFLLYWQIFNLSMFSQMVF